MLQVRVLPGEPNLLTFKELANTRKFRCLAERSNRPEEVLLVSLLQIRAANVAPHDGLNFLARRVYEVLSVNQAEARCALEVSVRPRPTNTGRLTS